MTLPESLARRRRIGAAFAAAQDYDRHARVQHEVAVGLAQRIAALPLPPDARVLEIGCGTGFLTGELVRREVSGALLVTDLAPAMIQRCRARLGDEVGRAFRVLDGERGERPAEAPFDLIASSLAFQWFENLPAALARLAGWLAPGGTLAFTTLAEGTFAEWREAHAALGLASGTPHFPSAEQLRRMAPAGFEADISVATHAEPQGSAPAFLKALKAIGAGTAAAAHQPLPPGALRQVMARFDAGGAVATYEVATCLLRREAA